MVNPSTDCKNLQSVIPPQHKKPFFMLRRKSSSPQLSLSPPPSYDASPQFCSYPTTPDECSEHRLDMVPGRGEEAEPAGTPVTSKARQKKFHRHFKSVPSDERVLNYYSCALVADILLQGHLYITKNYFAFYSNVFGYVTRLLIPTASVVKVTKEKTAYIIPNAVGIATEEEKHVFGSLLSRDSTYKLMLQVWKAAIADQLPNLPDAVQSKSPSKIPPVEELEKTCEDLPDLPAGLIDDESSVSGSESNTRSLLSSAPPQPTIAVDVKSYQDVFSQTVPTKQSYAQCYSYIKSVPRPTLLLIVSTLLLVLLFTSATVLLFRISRLQQGYSHNQLTSKSISEVQRFLDVNLEQISKTLLQVRQSLESLSLLIEGSGRSILKQRFPDANNFHQHNS